MCVFTTLKGKNFLFQNVKNDSHEIFLYIHKFDHEASFKSHFGCWCCELAIVTVPKSHFIPVIANSNIVFCLVPSI